MRAIDRDDGHRSIAFDEYGVGFGHGSALPVLFFVRHSGSGASHHPEMTVSDLELAPGDPPIGLEIALAGGLDHACRQSRRGRVAVPAAGAALGVKVVAQRLFVETRLRLARP